MQPAAWSLRAVALLAMAVVVGCSGGGSSARPDPPRTSTPTQTPTPSASPTFEPKPGGTVRIAGVARRVSLDPAAPVIGTDPSAELAGPSEADAVRLLGRLVLRQLYSYPARDAAHDPNAAAASAPEPDLAAGAPQLSDDGLTATIELRAARWAVPNPRRVTADDVSRALKRLCLPSVRSPVAGYLAESVKGYASACTSITSRPPRTIAALDAVRIQGITTQGDTTLVIQLLRPTTDLTALLALPETSPLPVESFEGLTVTSDPLRFVGDGPYRFVAPQDGEAYALSRSPSWGSDPLRRAFVDHVSVRGGFTAAQVRARIQSGAADLALDLPAPAATAVPQPATPQLVSNPALATVLLAVGSRGPEAARLGVPGVRRVLAACLDESTRRRIAQVLGSGAATSSSDLLDGLLPVPAGSPAPGVSGSAPASATSSATSASPAASPSASAAPASTACKPGFGVAGIRLRMLVPGVAPMRAAAGVLAARFAAAGVTVTASYAPPTSFAATARAGGWDLLLDARALPYPQPRALLAPLLDPRWRGADAVPVVRASQSAPAMLAAVAESAVEARLEAWNALAGRLSSSATLLPIAQLASLYTTGSNVASAPVVATLNNADPANVSLGSTRTSEPARSSTPTP